MYLMYVDECGDSGMKPESSRYFILSAIILHESRWTAVMTRFANQRNEFKEHYGFDPDLELHASHMMGRSSKKYTKWNKQQRHMMLRHAIALEATMADSIRVMNVVIDKKKHGYPYDPFTKAWDALINRFENTIEHGNFPGARNPGDDTGMIIVDETDEKKLRLLTRKMRWNNVVPSQLFPGGTVEHNLRCVIEDPLHKRSETSMLIQMCDINSFFLKQTYEPNASVVKYKARNLFYKLEPVLLKEARPSNEYGIVEM